MLDYKRERGTLNGEQGVRDGVLDSHRGTDKEPAIALLHCMDLIDDFLDHINISFETYCNEFVGSWMFGYINALKLVGVRTVLFCISARFTEVSRFTHVPTGTTICVLPASKSYLGYRVVRHQALKLYGVSEGKTFKDIQDSNATRRSLLTTLKNLAQSVGTYLSTPLGLLTQEIRREGCEAILCQEYEYARFDACVLLGKLMNLPVFATFQGGDKTHSFLEYPLRQMAFRGCTGVIVSTQKEIERVRDRYQVPPAKIARIFDPMDTETWYPIDHTQARSALGIPLDAQIVVCHGRIDFHRKGLDILVAAWETICRDRPDRDLRLLLLGTGPDADKLRQCIANMNLQGVIWRNEFVNDRSILRLYLSAADVYTLASRQEGFPIAPLEAMACGLPVVAADAPGVPDILQGGEISGGLVVPREDALALSQALGRVLDDEAWGRELGKRARRRIEEYFSPQVIGKQLRDFMLRQKVESKEVGLPDPRLLQEVGDLNHP
ncbi:MAG: glycosyltransferase family 4 protein [Chlorogloeopsis fritschii C42_A2020_084]|uniref:glycosyltransferase family 4 protein n=1 Tax=Chlorogloeopsis fritschii TaxID=1124 RepID=UPI0019E6773D|nr:glycosyltransferase family 4 protein [Chlorogloeopsis fritschii]MBF2007218.1 glycosyltransferase family 4 protein [Chlorogloeopsis fritschii C42_A2020_084]